MECDDTIAERLLETAIGLGAKGFRIFPLQVDQKSPAHDGWQAQATTDPTRIDELWRDPFGEVIPYNVGVATGAGLTVLDVDVKDGRQGLESLEDLKSRLGLDDQTLTVRTPSGGLHLYFDSTGFAVGNSASRIGQALDIRGEGGLVVGPGSTVGDGGYTIERDISIKPIAPWFAQLCGVHAQKPRSSDPLVELDTPEAIERAKAWLRNEAPHVVAGSGNGDHTGYVVACRLKDFGISEHEIVALCLEHFDDEKAHPPQGAVFWELKASNAYRHGQSAPGISHAMADFEVEELEQPVLGSDPGTASSRLRPDGALLAFDTDEALAFRAETKRPYLIKGFLSAGTMSMLFGTTNVGKTFVMLDMAFHVALGRSWNGRRTVKSPVIYVAAEGTYDIYDRMAAWLQHHNASAKDAWLTIVPAPLDLRTNTADLKRVIELVKSKIAQRQSNAPPLVVIDTYSRVMAGGDENGTVDSGTVVKHLDAIRFATGAHVAIVHHSGKDVERGSRGSTVVPFAADTELELRNGELRTKKQRAMSKEADPIPYTLKTIGLGLDDEGDEITSCVVLYGAAAEMAAGDGAPQLTSREAAWLELLDAGIGDMAEEKGVHVSQFHFTENAARSIFARGHDTDIHPAGALNRTTVVARLSALARKNVVNKVGRNQWVMADVNAVKVMSV